MKNFKKLISYSFYAIMLVLVIAILSCGLIAVNTGHMDCCEVLNCSLCEIIQNAINIVEQLFGIIIYMCISGIVVSIVFFLIYHIKLKIKRYTLIDLEIQHNE